MDELLHLLVFLGGGVCHRYPDRTLEMGGMAMVLCGRCSGFYLAAALSSAWIFLRGLAPTGRFPPGPLLAACLVLAPVSGIEWVLGSAGGLIPSTNLSRFMAGAISGTVLSPIVLPATAALLGIERGEADWRSTDIIALAALFIVSAEVPLIDLAAASLFASLVSMIGVFVLLSLAAAALMGMIGIKGERGLLTGALAAVAGILILASIREFL